MSDLSNYLETQLVNHVLRGVAYTSPGTSIYVALHTADPGEAGGGAEVSGGSYARVQVTGWSAPASRQTANSAQINFATPSAGWGTVTHVGIWDASSGGNLLFKAALAQSMNILTGASVYFPASSLTVSMTGIFSNYLAHKLLDHVLRNTAYTSPTTKALALYTTDPTVADSGTELATGSYARVAIATWDAPTDGATQNTNPVTFPQASADWNTTHWGLRDATTVGNLLFFGAKTYNVGSGGTLSIPAGDFDITLA